MYGSFHLHDAALGMLCIGLGAFRDDVDSFYDSAVLLDLHFEDSTGSAFVVAGIDVNGVALFDMKFCHIAL